MNPKGIGMIMGDVIDFEKAKSRLLKNRSCKGIKSYNEKQFLRNLIKTTTEIRNNLTVLLMQKPRGY